jgi:hypothetical protein
LISGRDPVTDAATEIGPIDGVASDGAYQCAIQPDAEVGPEPVLELGRCTREEKTDFVGRARSIHPREPLPQMVAIPLDCRKQDLGIVPPELPELEAVGYRAAKHFIPPVGCLRGGVLKGNAA